jgi:hypothetical protein
MIGIAKVPETNRPPRVSTPATAFYGGTLFMKHTLIVALALSAAVCQAAEDSFSKRLAAQPTGKLVVDIDFGSIEVSSNASNEVQIDVTRKVKLRSEAAETAFLAERPISVTDEGGTITIKARKPGKFKSWSFGGFKKLEGKYVIKVPAAFAANLQTQGGKIEVRDLSGGVKADTSGGSLVFSHIRGGLDGDTSGGGISVEDAEGTIKLDTSGGSIRVDGGSGTLKADTSGGSITVKNFKGDAHADTSGGGITFDKVQGELFGSTSGGSISATLDGVVEKPIRLDTSGGSITLSVPGASSFELDASTSGGGVQSEFTVEGQGKPDRQSIKGPVNGGGKPVKLGTSGGGIRIKKS